MDSLNNGQHSYPKEKEEKTIILVAQYVTYCHFSLSLKNYKPAFC
jgi:hypothetical protein